MTTFYFLKPPKYRWIYVKSVATLALGFYPSTADQTGLPTWREIYKWLERLSIHKNETRSQGAEIQWLMNRNQKPWPLSGFAPKGKTPVRNNPQIEKINKISSVTNQGKSRFRCMKAASMNLSPISQAINRRCKRTKDSCHSRQFACTIAKSLRWARRYAHLIELHYLLSYCPDSKSWWISELRFEDRIGKETRAKKGHG